MDNQTLVWPGHGTSIHHCHQNIEGEYLKADEYDLFLDDYSDYAAHYYPAPTASWLLWLLCRPWLPGRLASLFAIW
jgi:hypothetical protein